ncbi:MAG: exostosin family protein [Chthoniobacterales bacterium]
MARVLLLSATPEDDQTDYNLAPLDHAQKSAGVDRFRVHSLTDDPEAADLIIFLECYGGGWYFERVRAHPLVRRYREKCFLFSTNPFVIPFLPGIYTGIEKRWTSARTRPGFYLGRTQNDFTTFSEPADDLPYLFSFMGSVRNSPVREKLGTLRHPRSFFQNTSDDFERILQQKMDRRERLDYDRRYAEVTKASKFVLCPRGLSASSIRLFETMRMGRAPVILSDDWVPPLGPRWEEFAVQVRERDFARIPSLLEKRENEAVAMGQRARAEWEEWFSDEVLFHRLVELCLDIKNKRAMPESVGRWRAYFHFLQPFHVRRIAGSAYRFLRVFMKIIKPQTRRLVS